MFPGPGCDRTVPVSRSTPSRNRFISPPGHVRPTGALGADAGEVIVEVELPAHRVQVAYVGADGRDPGTEGIGLTRQLGVVRA